MVFSQREAGGGRRRGEERETETERDRERVGIQTRQTVPSGGLLFPTIVPGSAIAIMLLFLYYLLKRFTFVLSTFPVHVCAADRHSSVCS